MTELRIYPDSPGELGPPRTGIPKSLMHELVEHLHRFVETGETHTIDLKSLPATPADLEDLDAALGVGEVRADLAVIGKSQVWETKFSGVWRVRHLGTDDIVAADEIIVTSAPEILFSHTDDAREAVEHLRAAARDFQPNAFKEDTTHV